MKRFLSAIFAAVLLLTMLPFGAFAAEDKSSERDKLIAQACEVFPEYADKIRNQKMQPNSRSHSLEASKLIYSDSRDAPNNGGTILYSEYSDGIVLLTSYIPTKKVTVVDSHTGAGATAYTINIVATCSGISGTFTAKNVKYTTISSAYDRIDSVGTYKTETTEMTGYVACALQNDTPNPYVVMNESASGSAIITYKLTFRFAPYAGSFLTTELSLSVGHDSATVTHSVT